MLRAPRTTEGSKDSSVSGLDTTGATVAVGVELGVGVGVTGVAVAVGAGVAVGVGTTGVAVAVGAGLGVGVGNTGAATAVGAESAVGEGSESHATNATDISVIKTTVTADFRIALIYLVSRCSPWCP